MALRTGDEVRAGRYLDAITISLKNIASLWNFIGSKQLLHSNRGFDSCQRTAESPELLPRFFDGQCGQHPSLDLYPFRPSTPPRILLVVLLDRLESMMQAWQSVVNTSGS